ncbi:MAG: SpoIIE family protein phosphatase [Candidatus Tectomicrobia bacterium]|nr:SpoIIE family protein phosphatase [Candidatus Tectomicrobia bacterium]
MVALLRRVPEFFTSANLFNKLLGFIVLCLVCSGGLAAWLITQQMTHLVYTQTQVTLKSDARNVNVFLQQQKDWLETATADVATDETLVIAIELDVVEEVQNFAKDYQKLLDAREVVVANAQGQIMSRGYESRDRLDDSILGKSFGVIEDAGQYQMFSYAPIQVEDELIGHVVVWYALSGNRIFFQRLRETLGKDALVFAGSHEVGSTFEEPPGPLQPTPVAPGLFTAFDNRFIGTEHALGDVFGHADWRVVPLLSAAPLMRFIRWVKWGTVIFTLAFIGLIALVIGLFFAVHIRKPMTLIRQGIASITQGNLETRIYLDRRDEWRLIEEALNSMTINLGQNEAALQQKVAQITTLYEIGQEIAAQLDLDSTLELIVDRSRTLLGGHVGMLALRQEASDLFAMQAHSGAASEALSTLQLRPGQGLGGQVIETGQPVVVNDYEAEYGDSPFLQAVAESGVRSAVAVPLKSQDLVTGVLYVHSAESHKFNEEDSQLLSALADQTAIAIEKTKLYEQISAHAAELEIRVEERTAELAEANDEITALNEQLKAENLRMGAELEVTRQLQQMILPTPEELAAVSGLDIAGYMAPADEVGGDYYDVLEQNGQVKIGIGDVTGHGLESGMVMLMTQMAVRTLLNSGETDPVRFLDILNRTLFDNVQRMGTDKNLTLSLLDYANGEVRLSGQHEELIVARHEGTIELVDTVDLGFPIGLADEIADFISHTTLTLRPGDGVVLYTDGITEAENTAREQYGLERLCEMVREHWGQPAEAVKEAVVADVQQHIGTHEVYDDITLVVVKQQ